MITRYLAAIFLGLLMTQPAHASNAPEVIVAHRGFGEDAQVKYKVAENSIPAWQKAIDLAERDFIIDVDAQWTSDGVMVALHDRSLSRTTNGSGYIDQRTWSYVKARWMEIEGLDLNNNNDPDNLPYHPPSIEATLDFLQNKSINGTPVKVAIEMKGDKWTSSRVGALKTKLKSHGMFTNRVNVHSFNNTFAKYAHAQDFPNVAFVTPSNGPMPSVAAVKAVGNNVMVRHTLITPSKLNEYNQAGIRVWIWTVDEDSEYEKLWNLGKAYAWVCNDLPEAQEFLAEKEATQ